MTLAGIAGRADTDTRLRDRLKNVARYAEMAPSFYGTRPWELRFGDDAIELHSVSNNPLREVDIDGRESVIAAGSALFALRLAMRCHLIDVQVLYARDFREPSLLARLTAKGSTTPRPSEVELFSILTGGPGIPARNGLAHDFRRLLATACSEGVVMRYLENRFLLEMTASMLQVGDRLHYQSSLERDEFKSWLGIESLGPRTPSNDDFFDWTVSEDDWAEIGNGQPASLVSQDALAVICTQYEDEANWLNTGQALAHIHLAALAQGMKVKLFNQPLQVPGLRPRFSRETGFCNFPQVMFRVGYDAETRLRPDMNFEGHKSPCGCGCGGDC